MLPRCEQEFPFPSFPGLKATVFCSRIMSMDFLSDPSPIIGYACHSLTDSLTHSLTDSRLVKLIDMNLVCEKGNSKLVEVVTACRC